jgi:4'-phosphopantetheinyl transferase
VKISQADLSRVTPGGRRLSLANDAIDLWLAFDANFQAPEVQSKFVALLTSHDRDRMQRLQVDAVRQQFALTRALQRHALSAYEPEVSPAQWEFQSTAEGRPYLAPSFQHTGLHFNLSHTEGLVAMAVCRHSHVGVDVEKRGRVRLAVADRYFSTREAEQLRALPLEEQPRRFLRLWTLKEAYLKAIGTGIVGGLGRFSMLFSSAGEFRFEREDGGDAAGWQFRQFEIGNDHVLAFAVLPPADVTHLRLMPREFRVD